MSEYIFKNQLHECKLIPRNTGDILFYITEDQKIMCDLDRYTILPNEEYEKLKVQSETGTRNT